MSPERPHEALLRDRIGELLLGCTSFGELVEQLEGCDPITALEQLDLLATGTDSVIGDAAAAMAKEARAYPEKDADASRLPIPHPLDYHWSYSADTIDMLIEVLAQRTDRGETVVFLGTPNLFVKAGPQLPERRLVLIDRDGRLVDRVQQTATSQALTLDLLGDDLPALRAHWAVADPPWYPAYMNGFVSAAATLLRVGGSLMLSVPDLMTRPGVTRERRQLIEEAASFGMSAVRADLPVCVFETPPFEAAAFEAAGLRHVPKHWRRGPMLEFEKTRDVHRHPRGHREPESWQTFEIEEIPIQIRRLAPATGGQLLEELVPGEILASVSRRDPVRPKVALWSSRNRVFASSDPARLAKEVALIERDGYEAATDSRLAAKVEEIVIRERAEHGLKRRAGAKDPASTGNQ